VPAALRASSPSSRERLLGQALMARRPDAKARAGLDEAELAKWEAAVRRIASAVAPGPAGAPGGEGMALPCRVDATGSGLFLGDAACARDVAALEALGIGAVMNCGAPHVEYPAGFLHLEVSCEDAEGYPLFARHLEECLAFVERSEASKAGLLVHCVMGLNRSTAMVIAVMMLCRGAGLLEAVGRVWECRGRSSILTNRSFRRQLVQLSHLAGCLS